MLQGPLPNTDWPFAGSWSGHRRLRWPWEGVEKGPSRIFWGSGPFVLHFLGSWLSFLEPPYVDAGGLSPNTWERLERLSSAWEQARLGIERERPQGTEPESGVVMNPTRRSQTPLAPNEVDAIRTARAHGESVLSICRRFDIHRVAVWEKTRTN